MRDYPMQGNMDFAEGGSGECENSDAMAIKALIPGCEKVIRAHKATDKNGVDYLAVPSDGPPVLVDVKRRRPGCRKFWKTGEPDLQLEIWSVMPCKHCPAGKIGWTLNAATKVQQIVFVFDPSDCGDRILPFQQLRGAFQRYRDLWVKTYGTAEQSSDGGKWKSQVVFVPWRVVWAAIYRCSYLQPPRTEAAA